VRILLATEHEGRQQDEIRNEPDGTIAQASYDGVVRGGDAGNPTALSHDRCRSPGPHLFVSSKRLTE